MGPDEIIGSKLWPLGKCWLLPFYALLTVLPHKVRDTSNKGKTYPGVQEIVECSSCCILHHYHHRLVLHDQSNTGTTWKTRKNMRNSGFWLCAREIEFTKYLEKVFVVLDDVGVLQHGQDLYVKEMVKLSKKFFLKMGYPILNTKKRFFPKWPNIHF